MSLLATLEGNIVGQLQTISYLQDANGGTARGVADEKTFLDLTTVASPAAILVFDGETASPPLVLGRSVQESKLQWTAYLISQSFGTDGEGRLTATVGSYSILDDVFMALEGFTVNTTPLSRLYYSGSARFNVLPNVIVYESKWYCQLPRIGAS
jgi:hypothetical protein